MKIDIHSDEMFYKDLTFSDFNVVKLLLQHRDKYDQYYGIAQNNHFNVAGDVKRLNKEMIHTYVDLDELIERCKFNKEQLYILNSIPKGYSYQEIAVQLGKSKNTNIRNRFNKICRDIVKMNNWLWMKCVYIDKLELKSKRCSKCEECLPATDEFFSPYDKNSDGYFTYCKKCR